MTGMTTPKLRFPGFQDPWKPTAVSALLERQSVPVDVDPTQTYRQIGVRSHGKGIFHKDAVTGTELGDKRVFQVVPDALVVNIVFAWEQAVALTSDAEAGFIASHRFPMFTAKYGKSYLPFLRQMFLTKRGKILLEMASPGGAGRNKTLGQQEFLKLKPVVPSRAEQKKIADAFGAVDAKLTALAAKQAALGRFKAGLMQKLFSQQIRFKRDDGGDFPDWEELPFEKIASRGRSAFNPQKSKDRPTLIELENIEGGTGKIVGHSDLDGQISLKSTFRTGDVLFGKLRPYLRKYARPNFDGVCSSEIWVLHGRKVSNAFLFYLVQSSLFIQVANISTGSKMPRSDWATIADTGFEIPHPDEQAKIADALSAMDAKIQAVADQLARLQTFKKGLLQQLFV